MQRIPIFLCRDVLSVNAAPRSVLLVLLMMMKREHLLLILLVVVVVVPVWEHALKESSASKIITLTLSVR